MSWRIPKSRPLAAAALLLLQGACASATKRYEQGQELEQQGRSVEAAQRYVDALRKDASLVEARQRLVETGARAVTELARQADGLDATGGSTDAADVLRTADALIRDASGVGVALVTPVSYGQRHAVVFGRAVDQAIDLSIASGRRGDFAGAVQWVERAQQRWEPRADRLGALNGALAEAHIAWAQSEMSAARFRSAFAQAEAAAAVPGYGRAEARDIQAEAIRRGTVLIVAFPTGARSGTDNRLLPEVNDILVADHWRHPPQWLEVVNMSDAQRVVRQRGLAGRDLDVQDASMLGRQLGARFAVTSTLDSVRYTESKVERHRRVVKTRAGVDTAFTTEDGQLESWARVSWRVIDVRAGRGIVERSDASARATVAFHRATYEGSWRDLNLTTADRTLFEQRDARENLDMWREIGRDMAERIGRDVYAALLRRVE